MLNTVRESPLEQLIGMDASTPSDDRRAILRAVTDSFMAASDRYGPRDMALFDLLLSRTAQAMDGRVRRLYATALIKAGAKDTHVREALMAVPSPNIRLLRRSVTQTRRDIVCFLKESALEWSNYDTQDIPLPEDPLSSPLDDGHQLGLPSTLVAWLYLYQSAAYRGALTPRVGEERAAVLARTALRFQEKISAESTEAATSEIVVARRTIRDWARRGQIADSMLVELLEARAMTEFIFALMNRFDIDCATTFRVLNDMTFESFALLARAAQMRRSVFAKALGGFRNRRSDGENGDRILALYERLTPESAERAVRFWRIRASDMARGEEVSSSGDDARAAG